MRKFVSCVVLLALLLCMSLTVSAAGSASISGPSTVRAGDTITVTFYAGGGILGGAGSVSYDDSVLTLQGYSSAVGGTWAVEFNGNNFVFYDNSMENPITGSSSIFKATFKVSSSAEPGSTISVTASGITLSDGESDTGAGSRSYSATIAKPLSDNCNLSSMTVSGATISPAFSPSVTNYSASVPFATSSISVNATAEDPAAKVSINNPSLTAGGTTNVRVTVTAENGATKTYTIAVKREQDPNYVKSSNNNLGSLSVEGYVLSPAFSADVTQYYVWLPYETEQVSISASAADGKASSSVGACDSLTPGVGTDVPVTVTAEDGSQKVYTVTVVRAPEHSKAEQYLTGEREPAPTEPATEPVTEPAAEPEITQPATEIPMEAPVEKEGKTYGAGMLIAVAIISAAAGAAILAIINSLRRRNY